MNISIKYQDFMTLVMASSSFSGAKMEGSDLLNIFINTLSEQTNKNNIITIMANALSIFPAKETDLFLSNNKVCENINHFDNFDKEKLMLKLYIDKIKYSTFNKVINAISFEKKLSTDLNNKIEDALLKSTKKYNFLKALEIGYTPSQTLFYHIAEKMERANDKTTPDYNDLRNMLCVAYAFNEKYLQLQEKDINLFMFDYGHLHQYNNVSDNYIKHLENGKHPHLTSNNITNTSLLELFSGKISTNSLSYIIQNETTKNPALKFEHEEIMNSIRNILSQTLEHQKNSGFNQLINDLVLLTKEHQFFEKMAKINKNKPKYSQLNSIIENALLELHVTKSNLNMTKVKI